MAEFSKSWWVGRSETLTKQVSFYLALILTFSPVEKE